MMRDARHKYPQLEAYLGEVSKESVTKMYGRVEQGDSKPGVSIKEFEAALTEVDSELKMLPPTAQVAAQQGEYLAKILNGVPFEGLGHESGFEPKFEYKHAGSMAYVGGEHAVIDSPLFGVQSGIVTYIMWKGVYWGKSLSLNNKIQMVFGWAKSWFMGRDTSRF